MQIYVKCEKSFFCILIYPQFTAVYTVYIYCIEIKNVADVPFW